MLLGVAVIVTVVIKIANVRNILLTPYVCTIIITVHITGTYYGLLCSAIIVYASLVVCITSYHILASHVFPLYKPITVNVRRDSCTFFIRDVIRALRYKEIYVYKQIHVFPELHHINNPD